MPLKKILLPLYLNSVPLIVIFDPVPVDVELELELAFVELELVSSEGESVEALQPTIKAAVTAIFKGKNFILPIYKLPHRYFLHLPRFSIPNNINAGGCWFGYAEGSAF
jgi:hypothetical protein